jgi:hypothetical protein
MAEKEKTLEMRVAEIEDKLAQMHITDEEMKAFNKVAGAMGLTGGAEGAPMSAPAAGGASAAAAPSRAIAINRGLCIQCIVPRRGIQCIIFCNECTCGPCTQGGGGGFGGGFGGFGM